MKSVSTIAAFLALAAASTEARTRAQGLAAYPASWSAAIAGSPLPASSTAGKPVFDDETRWLSVAADGVLGSNWYAPIRGSLGTGKLAAPTDRQAISLATNCLTLQTRNPSQPGGVDVHLQTLDSHGHGFTITNGYVEAGISLPAAHGSHAGFWMDTIPQPTGHGEIDAPETYGAADRIFAQAAHWWGNGKGRIPGHVSAGYYWGAEPTTAQEYATWHSYGILLTPASICTYMDRKEVACIPRLAEQLAPFYVELSVFTDANRKDGYEPATMRVAYVRAWGK